MTSGEGIPTDASPQNNSSDGMRESERVERRAGKQHAKRSKNSSNERSNRPPSYNKRGNKCYTQCYPSSLPPRHQDWAGRSNYCPPNPWTSHVGTSRRRQQVIDQEPLVSNPNHLNSWFEDHPDRDLHDYMLRPVSPVKQESDDDWYRFVRVEAIPVMMIGPTNRDRVGWQRLREGEMNRLGWSRIADQGVVFNSSGQPRDNWTNEELEHNRSYWTNQLGHYLQRTRGQKNPSGTNADVELELADSTPQPNVNHESAQGNAVPPFHRETPPHRPHHSQPPYDHNGGSGGGGRGGGSGNGNGGGSSHPSSTTGDASRHSRRDSNTGPPNRGPNGGGPPRNDPPGGGPPDDRPPNELYYGDNDNASSEDDGWQAISQQYYGDDSVNSNQGETGLAENRPGEASNQMPLESMNPLARQQHHLNAVQQKFHAWIQKHVGEPAPPDPPGMRIAVKVNEPDKWLGGNNPEKFESFLMKVLRWMKISRLGGPTLEGMRVSYLTNVLDDQAL